MKFRLGTLLLLVAALSIGLAAYSYLNRPPKAVRTLIGYLADLPAGCTKTQFDDFIDGCETIVDAGQGNDEVVFWHIRLPKGSKSANQQAGMQQRPIDGCQYLMSTEYGPPVGNEQSLSRIAIHKVDLQSGLDSKIWSWQNND